MKQHVDNTRRQLGELAAMAQQTEASEREILKRAEARLEQVEADIAAARKDAITDQEAAQRYQDLILERGHLHQVIAQAREVLPSS